MKYVMDLSIKGEFNTSSLRGKVLKA